MYDKTKLLEILLNTDCRTIQNCGRPYPPSAEVYRMISKKMMEFNSRITPKHIYVLINENRNGFKDKILEAFNIKINDADVFHNTSTCSIETIKNDSVNTFSKEFDLIISAEQWKIIMPVQKLYGRRYKYVLQNGWTDVIAERMWQQQKFQCTIAFKKHDVHQSSSAKYYIGIHGQCKECKATIKGKIIHKPRDNVDVKIHFKALNIEEEKHSYTVKRQLKGKRRKIVTATLIEKKMNAITFRRQEAKRLKDFGDINSS